MLLVPLAAFGGTYASVALPVGLATIACALAMRPHLHGALDAALLVLLVCIALQLVPLPSALVATLSPHAQPVRDMLALLPPSTGVGRPLSIRAPHTEWAFVVVAGAIALFLIARVVFARGGVRRTIRGIAAIGFAASGLAIAQAATAGRSIYWRFPTEYEGPLPFGPFINRNHFATWTIMALPLTIGYLVARSQSGPHEPPDNLEVGEYGIAVDSRGAWLTAAAAMMLLALFLSLSRSGISALATSGAVTIVAMRHAIPHHRRWMLGGVAVAVVFGALAWADVPALAKRLAAAPVGISGRQTIWRETLPIVRDFWLTGTGAGTYQQAMFVYQQSDRRVFFNQAHNHYLQIAAEGGLLLVTASAIALVAFMSAAVAAFRRQPASKLWIRAGAACGLGAVFLQSLWETGLVMPANAMLAATLAAIVLHEDAERRARPRSTVGSWSADSRVRHDDWSPPRHGHTSRSTRRPPPR